MEPKFAVIAVWAEDVIAATHFYRDVLKLKLLTHHEGLVHFDVNGVYLLILKGRILPAQNSESSHFPLFAISVEDFDERLGRLEKHGITMPWGIEMNETSRWIIFNDPAGNLIELVQFNQ